MKISLTNRDRGTLRQGALFGSSRDVRLRCLILLHLADGRPVSRLAALAGVSRMTVYQWVRVFATLRSVAALDPKGITGRDRLVRRMKDPGAGEPRPGLRRTGAASKTTPTTPANSIAFPEPA